MTVERFLTKNIRTKVAFGALLTALVLPCSSFAASNGCDKEDYDRINPAIALCSTHVYNIGQTQNQVNEANKQVMRDVVALKTTIITQQMQQQYDFLEATLKRLKTQLEKAVLTTKFEAAGASGSSSGSSSSENGMPIASAENCRLSASTLEVMNCLSRNLNKISQAINGSDFGDASRQIKEDLETLKLYNHKDLASNISAVEEACKNVKNNRNDLNKCVDNMRVSITRNIEAIQKENSRSGYNRY